MFSSSSAAERFWNASDLPEAYAGNGSEGVGGGGGEEEEAGGECNYYAMLYSLLILAIVFGNVLVCVAVLRERSLQTTTNYLVVSLAVADLLVASLVMPWAVYLEVVGGAWLFSRLYCNVFVMLDVMMCTASILNLCAISIDRFNTQGSLNPRPSAAKVLKRLNTELKMLWGVFLICWLPFFVTHILNTHCSTCYIPPTLYSAVTWLGYVNSALNPVIYTTFNIEFRRAFIKILSC
ncbi:unnamed protein product [Merluccius merluccius]